MEIYIGERPSPRAQALARRLDTLDRALAPDLCVVLGGDGSMLHAVHRSEASARFLGINCGYLGFLMNDLPGDEGRAVEELVAAIEGGTLLEQSFPCLGFRSGEIGRAHV